MEMVKLTFKYRVGSILVCEGDGKTLTICAEDIMRISLLPYNKLMEELGEYIDNEEQIQIVAMSINGKISAFDPQERALDDFFRFLVEEWEEARKATSYRCIGG
jgi:hypothetical protein